jgi:hypothetical protein
MNINQDDDEQIAGVEEDAEDFSAPAMVDPVAAALALTDLVDTLHKAYKLAITDKANRARLRAVAKLDRQAADAVAVRDEAQAAAAVIVAKIEHDTNALAERERAHDAREAAFEASLREAHDNLRQYYDNLAQEDKRIRYRILSSADLLHGYNARLQELPSWPAIKQMIPGLPADLPATPPAEVVTREVTTDWTGSHSFIAGSTLTRSVPS